jgi:hypothetical protein
LRWGDRSSQGSARRRHPVSQRDGPALAESVSIDVHGIRQRLGACVRDARCAGESRPAVARVVLRRGPQASTLTSLRLAAHRQMEWLLARSPGRVERAHEHAGRVAADGDAARLRLLEDRAGLDCRERRAEDAARRIPAKVDPVLVGPTDVRDGSSVAEGGDATGTHRRSKRERRGPGGSLSPLESIARAR